MTLQDIFAGIVGVVRGLALWIWTTPIQELAVVAGACILVILSVMLALKMWERFDALKASQRGRVSRLSLRMALMVSSVILLALAFMVLRLLVGG